MEYEEIPYNGKTIKLFNSYKARRLEEEGETYEEYKIRQAAIKSYMKNRKNMKHVAQILIPKMDKESMMDEPTPAARYLAKEYAKYQLTFLANTNEENLMMAVLQNQVV